MAVAPEETISSRCEVNKKTWNSSTTASSFSSSCSYDRLLDESECGNVFAIKTSRHVLLSTTSLQEEVLRLLVGILSVWVLGFGFSLESAGCFCHRLLRCCLARLHHYRIRSCVSRKKLKVVEVHPTLLPVETMVKYCHYTVV